MMKASAAKTVRAEVTPTEVRFGSYRTTLGGALLMANQIDSRTIGTMV
jgi:hypothetical protein